MIVTRGVLLRVVTGGFEDGGRLYAGQQVAGNALVSISGGPRHTIYVDGQALETTGPEDERPVPDEFAHRIVAALRTARGADPELDGEVLAYLEAERAAAQAENADA